VLILMRYLGSEKVVLSVKVSVGLMSRPLGCLVKGRILAQARDWSVRFSSAGAVGMGWLVMSD
jgi:hypothetical protein